MLSCPGKRIPAKAIRGDTLLETAKDNKILLPAVCGGKCTSHAGAGRGHLRDQETRQLERYCRSLELIREGKLKGDRRRRLDPKERLGQGLRKEGSMERTCIVAV